MYKCKRCDQDFARKDYLATHLKRKIPCEVKNQDVSPEELLKEIIKPVLSNGYPCINCGKFFEKPASKYQHEKFHCKKKDNEIQDIKNKLEEITRQHDELKKQMEMLGKTSNKSVVNNNKNCVVNNITINNFGEENTEHVLNDKHFLEACLKNIANDGIKNLLEKIHYDKLYTGNNNVRLKSRKREQLEVFHSNKWNIMDKNETLDKMIKNGYKILNTFYNDPSSEMKEYDVNKLDGKLFQLMMLVGTKDSSVYYPIRKKVFALVCNNTCVLMEGPEEGS